MTGTRRSLTSSDQDTPHFPAQLSLLLARYFRAWSSAKLLEARAQGPVVNVAPVVQVAQQLEALALKAGASPHQSGKPIPLSLIGLGLVPLASWARTHSVPMSSAHRWFIRGLLAGATVIDGHLLYVAQDAAPPRGWSDRRGSQDADPPCQ